ncbi:MAG: hypothetical protein EPO09_18980 [Aquabacterium sp.]|uniref:hypothetical protein n=1 Tax=Aquabacterium sp. TaxID=1872578 RepID=UPI00121F84DF|nr:hypothetical protein [Aquabacterium sp.]TAK87079.1 MAG: hypothetical protein EPO09_18980 [Aquabacterium sp.]
MAKKPATRDPMGPFVRVYQEVLRSPSWGALSWTGKALYLALRSKMNGSNNGNINAALSQLRDDGFTSSSTLAKALRELLAVGLIAKTRASVGVVNGSNVCSLFRFTDQDCYAVPKLGLDAVAASHDWRRFESVEQARAAIKTAEVDAKTQAPKKKSAVRNSNCVNSKSELRTSFDSSNFEHPQPSSVRNSNRRRHPAKQPKTPMDKGFQGVQPIENQICLTTSKFEHLLTVAIPMVESEAPRMQPEAMRVTTSEQEQTV